MTTEFHWTCRKAGEYFNRNVEIKSDYVALTNTTWWAIYRDGKRVNPNQSFTTLRSAKRIANIVRAEI